MTRAMVLLLALAIIVSGVLLVAWLFQRSLIYFPFGDVPSPADVGLDEVEVVSFPTADGLTLRAWFVPAAAEPRFAVVVFNGNAGNRGHRASLAVALRRHGFQTLLMDYRGYGGNPGVPTETGLLADARAARVYLENRPDVDSSRVVYFGESLGSAVAMLLAAETTPAALILRSPFPSLASVGRVHYPFLPVGQLLRDRFASIDVVAKIFCPALVIAGDRDGIVPVDQSRQLFETLNGPKMFVTIEGADHNDYELLAGEEMIASIVGFLEGL